MKRAATEHSVNFNFTTEQQERFDLLWEATQKEHPHLIKDEIQRGKTKVILAHFIINENKDNEEIKDEVINKDNDRE